MHRRIQSYSQVPCCGARSRACRPGGRTTGAGALTITAGAATEAPTAPPPTAPAALATPAPMPPTNAPTGPKCGHRISSEAEACPACGHPMAAKKASRRGAGNQSHRVISCWRQQTVAPLSTLNALSHSARCGCKVRSSLV